MTSNGNGQNSDATHGDGDGTASVPPQWSPIRSPTFR